MWGQDTQEKGRVGPDDRLCGRNIIGSRWVMAVVVIVVARYRQRDKKWEARIAGMCCKTAWVFAGVGVGLGYTTLKTLTYTAMKIRYTAPKPAGVCFCPGRVMMSKNSSRPRVGATPRIWQARLRKWRIPAYDHNNQTNNFLPRQKCCQRNQK